MEYLAKRAFESLSTWPLVQGAVAIAIIIATVLLALKALRDNGKPDPVPAVESTLPVTPEWLITQLVKFDVEQQKIGHEIAGIREDMRALGKTVERLGQALRRRSRKGK